MTKLMVILIRITGVKLTKKLSPDLLAYVSEIRDFLYNVLLDIKDIHE
jgi:hypothetical protein